MAMWVPLIMMVVSSLMKNDEPAPQQQQQQAAAPPPLAATPVTPEVPAMPTPDGEAVNMQKRRSIAEQQRRRGRASTILTDTADEPLGG